MSSPTFFPPPGAKGSSHISRPWLLAALLAAPLTAGAGFASEKHSVDGQTSGRWVADIDMDEFESEPSFQVLSAGSVEAQFPWAGRDVLASEPDWQNAMGTSLMPSAIPEPQAAAMWLTGLVAFGFIARRRSGG